ncbi:Multiple epidermal growth factor-like domains protein 8 [Mortierella antarctica]|nr:Multiple epidermal growth factor-like domains protein 8 [Mortierella antarctica]
MIHDCTPSDSGAEPTPRKHRRIHIWKPSFCKVLTLLLCIACAFTPARAQSPIPVTAVAYTTVDEKTLYIQGGIISIVNGSVTGDTNQLYALDLTREWNATNPSWTSVAIGSGTSQVLWGHSMTYSKATNSLIVWSTVLKPAVYTYSITSNASTVTQKPLPAKHTGFMKLRAVTDPNTGLVYLPSGMNNGTEMAVYHPSNGTFTSVAMASPMVMTTAIAYYSVVWSTLRNSMILYGGFNIFDEKEGNPYLIEFNPRTASWSRILTTGENPGDIAAHCMVSAHNGTKLIVFGGYTIGKQVLGSIYILDVQTMVWSRGQNTDPSMIRSEMACTFAGDSFIAWGGEYLAQRIEGLGTPIIYNIKSNTWTTEFSPFTQSRVRPSTSATTAPSPTDSPAVAGPKYGSAAGVGAAVGAAIVFVSFLGFWLYRRYSRHRKQSRPDSIAKETASGNTDDAGPKAEGHEISQGSLPTPQTIPGGNVFQHVPTFVGEYPYTTLAAAHSQPTPAGTEQFPQAPLVMGQYQPQSPVVAQYLYNPASTSEYQPPPVSPAVYHLPPTPSGEDDEFHDQRLREQIEVIQAQQEVQYWTQQEQLRRLRNQQQEQLRMLQQQLKPKKAVPGPL